MSRIYIHGRTYDNILTPVTKLFGLSPTAINIIEISQFSNNKKKEKHTLMNGEC